MPEDPVKFDEWIKSGVWEKENPETDEEFEWQDSMRCLREFLTNTEDLEGLSSKEALEKMREKVRKRILENSNLHTESDSD